MMFSDVGFDSVPAACFLCRRPVVEMQMVTELEVLALPEPQPVQRLEGHHRIIYGPTVITRNREFAAALGSVMAYFAEAERHLEQMLKSVAGGNPKVLAVLLASFRGHKQLLGSIELALKEAGQTVNHETLRSIRPVIQDAWAMRDRLAHAIWADCDLYPGSALRMSAKALGRTQEASQEKLLEGDFEAAFQAYRDIDAEAWSSSDFEQASRCADGALNSIMAFATCISRSPQEAAELHSLLRSQGLLSAPPWKLPNSIHLPESDDTH